MSVVDFYCVETRIRSVGVEDAMRGAVAMRHIANYRSRGASDILWLVVVHTRPVRNCVMVWPLTFCEASWNIEDLRC